MTVWRAIERALARAAIGVVRAYQLVVSPWLGPRCRFTPSCSHYACEALQQHGFIGGSWLTLRRLGRCHPFHRGGHDPVPPVRSQRCLGDATSPVESVSP